MTDERLCVIVVGFGWWGRHIAARLKDHAGFALRGVVEPDPGAHDDVRAMGLAPLPDLDAALADDAVRAVILTSPNDLHDAHVAACAAAGKHVFCEKPLSLTAMGAKGSVAACRAAGIVLGVGHERRFETAILHLRRMLDAGELGTIMHAELSFSHNKLKDLPSTSWRTSKTHAPAAGMTQMGIHLTDLLIWFFGRVSRVHAITADRSLGWETGDMVTVHLGFEEGMTASIQAILNTPHNLRTAVFGSDMWVEIRNATHPDTPGGLCTMERYRSIDDTVTDKFDWTDSVTANLEAFREAILGGAPYPYSDFELTHNIEVLEAIIASARDGRAVFL